MLFLGLSLLCVFDTTPKRTSPVAVEALMFVASIPASPPELEFNTILTQTRSRWCWPTLRLPTTTRTGCFPGAVRLVPRLSLSSEFHGTLRRLKPGKQRAQLRLLLFGCHFPATGAS
jgi:hypothetical protein